MASIRYVVGDVDRAVAFYTQRLGFTLKQQMGPAFAYVSRDDLTLWLSGPQSSAARPMPDGRRPEPGGWNRLVLEVKDLPSRVAALKQAGGGFVDPGRRGSPAGRPRADRTDHAHRRPAGRGARARSDRDRPPVLVGGALPGERRRRGQRNSYPGGDRAARAGRVGGRDPQLLGAPAGPQDRRDTGAPGGDVAPGHSARGVHRLLRRVLRGRAGLAADPGDRSH